MKQKYILTGTQGLLLPAFFICLASMLILSGCNPWSGYSSEPLYPSEVKSVCVQMFESKSFRRGVEYKLTETVCKRIESQTGYKVISNRDMADTLLTGQITMAGMSVLTGERETGRAMEKDFQIEAVVNWKNLKTSEMLLDDVTVSASASYSEWLNQGTEYAGTLAVNKLAKRIVELMEKSW